MNFILHEKSMPYLVQLFRLRSVRLRALLSALNLHPSQFYFLSLLEKEESLKQSEIAKRLMIKPSSLSVMIQKMEREGAIKRESDTQDGRIMRVSLTEKGRTLIASAHQAFIQVEEETFNLFSREERELVDSFLIKMRDNLVEVTQNKESPCRWC